MAHEGLSSSQPWVQKLDGREVVVALIIPRDMAINIATAPPLSNFWTHRETHDPDDTPQTARRHVPDCAGV